MLDSNISSEFYIKKAAENRERPINLPIQPCVFVIQVQPLFVFTVKKLQKPFRNDLAFVAACRRRRHHGLDLGQELRPSSPGLKVMEPSSLSDEVSTLTFY